MTEYQQMVCEQVLAALRQAHRDLQRAVRAADVQPRLPYDRSESSIRRDLRRLWEAGKVERVGGSAKHRLGYVLAC